MFSKVVLWGTGIGFIGYGLVSFFDPQIATTASGLGLTNGDSWVEAAAIFGGLHAGLGLFCLIAALRPQYQRAGLLAIICAVGSLAGARGIAFALASDPVTQYTYQVLGGETLMAVLAAVAFFRTDAEPSELSAD